MEPKLSGITADDVYFLAMMRIQWPELMTEFELQENKMRTANNLRDPGFFRPPGRLE